MHYEWLATFLIAAVLVAWISARFSERVTLERYPFATRIRLYVPFLGWRERVDASDHELLQPIRNRVRVGWVGMALIVVLAGVLANRPSALRAPFEPPAEPNPHVVDLPRPAEPARIVMTDEPEIETTVESSPGPEAEVEVEPEIDQAELRELRRPTRLYGTAKVKPVYRLHDVEGALITNIDPNSFWALLGVRNGDVVIELHGEPVDNPAVLVALMNVMERDDHVALAVRGTDGEVRYLEYRVPDSARR